MIDFWLALPLPVLLVSLVLFYGATGALLVWLSFGSRTGPGVQSFKGTVGPFVTAMAALLAIIIGFLASDIWDRERRAAATVRAEANQLIALDRLAATFNLPRNDLDAAIRVYAATVVDKEWAAMAQQQPAPEAEAALDELLKAVDALRLGATGRGDLDRLMMGTALDVRDTRNTRLGLAQDHSEDVKWWAVLALALMAQVSVALVHLDQARPQIASMAVLTLSLVIVIGLLASHELPFAPPLAVSPAPIAHVLDVVPG